MKIAPTIQILILSIINILFYFILKNTTGKIKSKNIRMSVSIICIILVTIIIFYITDKLLNTDEKFFFKVSPGRQQCMDEQVSQDPNLIRSPQCCGRGTVGGIPSRYADSDFIDPNPGWNWPRVDAFADYDSISPPTQKCGGRSII